MLEGAVPVDRELTTQESNLLAWLLRHGKPQAEGYLAQLDGVRVVSRCACGCSSVDFVRDVDTPMEVLADFRWTDSDGHVFGVFAFARDARLAGLEVWSIDGAVAPTALPSTSVLIPLDAPT